MIEKKTKTFIFEGLGFPVKLINAPWKKIFGEWALDINLNELQNIALQALIHKPSSLTGEELRFLRKFLEMTTVKFGKLFGVSHVAVINWEYNKAKINPATEICIRLYIMDYLSPKDKEFRNFYHEMNIENLRKGKKSEQKSIKIDVEKRNYTFQ